MHWVLNDRLAWKRPLKGLEATAKHRETVEPVTTSVETQDQLSPVLSSIPRTPKTSPDEIR